MLVHSLCWNEEEEEEKQEDEEVKGDEVKEVGEVEIQISKGEKCEMVEEEGTGEVVMRRRGEWRKRTMVWEKSRRMKKSCIRKSRT